MTLDARAQPLPGEEDALEGGAAEQAAGLATLMAIAREVGTGTPADSAGLIPVDMPRLTRTASGGRGGLGTVGSSGAGHHVDGAGRQARHRPRGSQALAPLPNRGERRSSPGLPGPGWPSRPAELDWSSGSAKRYFQAGLPGQDAPPRPSSSREGPAARPLRTWARVRHLLLVTSAGLVVAVVFGLALDIDVVRLPDGGMLVAAGWPGMRYLIYGVWMVPLAELGLLGLGQFHYRFRFRYAEPGTFTGLIIQVTTTGREQDRVNEIIEQIRGYRLGMSYQIWVVTEPGQGDHYLLCDRVLAVPADFKVRSQRKARALEYSRRVRVALGLNRPDVKILFNDDDVAPTRGYIETAFAGDYDICEGITAPRVEYAVRPLGHFLASHADDMRTHACLVYCSVFQGVLGRPLHVHGEGLTVTGEAESIVTWDWPAFASEDLVFGQRAARAGLRWGWFHEYVELTSPWTFGDFITQRRRWLWGDIHGIVHREVLSWPGALLVAAKYLFGLVAVVFSVSGLYLRTTGQMPGAASVYDVAKLSILAWLAVFFSCGWIGASSRVSPRNSDSRLLNAVAAVLMAPVSLALTLAGVVVPLIQGNPRTFQVISKTRRRAR